MTSSVLKFVIIKAVQGTCLRTNWCEVLLLHKSQYLNKDTKERKNVSEVKRKLLKYSICFYDGKNFKIKKTNIYNKLEAIKIGNLGSNSQLWYRK